MSTRSRVGKFARRRLGDERIAAWVRRERAARTRLAQRIAPPPAPKKKPQPKLTAAKATSFVRSDPFASFPEPAMSRHELLQGLHDVLVPRTYLEVGVNTGASLNLSKARSIGVDPTLSKVKFALPDDVLLVEETSDDFFARESAVEFFGGIPVDLAFIDGLHVSEYALRDFMNTEPLMAPAGVVVFDDMLPRNSLEAARDRRTQLWAGDVYKVLDVLRRNRPDLAIIPVNTAPTGTVVVVGLDPTSGVLDAVYETELVLCQEPDPQRVPDEFLSRSFAVNAAELLASSAWSDLLDARDGGGPADVAAAVSTLRGLPCGR